jgi:hypothetical protein
MVKNNDGIQIVVRRRHTRWGLMILLAFLLASMAFFLSGPPQPVYGEYYCNWNYVCEVGEDWLNCPSDCKKPKLISHCSNFNIAKRVPQAPAVPISFRGSANIDSAEVYFKKLGFSLSLYLWKYDWGSVTWHGFLNTTYLPLGKHHGLVKTYVNGVRGSGCETRGFKVVKD